MPASRLLRVYAGVVSVRSVGLVNSNTLTTPVVQGRATLKTHPVALHGATGFLFAQFFANSTHTNGRIVPATHTRHRRTA